MCPLCLSTAAWVALGGGSAASLAAFVAAVRTKGTNDGDNRDGSSGRKP
jgi:hypothetical protein